MNAPFRFPEVRLVLCSACEGDSDGPKCRACEGIGTEIVEVEPIDMEDYCSPEVDRAFWAQILEMGR